MKITISDDDGDNENKPKVNCRGYLIDLNNNIIDREGHIVFKKEILSLVEDKKGNMVPAELPFVYRDKNVEEARLRATAFSKT